MTGDPTKSGIRQTIRNLLPKALLRERDIMSRLGPKARAVYARLKLLDSLGVRSQNTHFLGPNPHSVVFVCFGNIMRSPMAEALFRKAALGADLTDVEISSAGLHAIPGREAHPWALRAAAEMGLPLTEHRARRLTPEMVSRADSIFSMDLQNKAELLAFYPESRKKILMLSAFADGKARDREIPDPYFGNLDTTRCCYVTLQTCVLNLTAALVALRTIRVPPKAPSGSTEKRHPQADIAHR
jgi:protein-tyrosine-phosphatase